MSSLAELNKRDKEKDEKKDNTMFNGNAGGGSTGIDHGNTSFANQRETPVPEAAPQVILYQDGFTIEQNPNNASSSNSNGAAGGSAAPPVFRPIADPYNKKFMDDIRAGALPQELEGLGPNISIGVIDRSKQKYKPPQAPLTGGVQTVGGGNRAIDLNNVDMSGGLASGPTASNANAEVRGFDENAPKTTINIRFGDGRKKAKQFNLTQHTQALADFVQECTGTGDFVLTHGFPPAKITDLTKTIKENDLEQAMVTVKQS